jgi:hypothetical protein
MMETLAMVWDVTVWTCVIGGGFSLLSGVLHGTGLFGPMWN